MREYTFFGRGHIVEDVAEITYFVECYNTHFSSSVCVEIFLSLMPQQDVIFDVLNLPDHFLLILSDDYSITKVYTVSGLLNIYIS